MIILLKIEINPTLTYDNWLTYSSVSSFGITTKGYPYFLRMETRSIRATQPLASVNGWIVPNFKWTAAANFISFTVSSAAVRLHQRTNISSSPCRFFTSAVGLPFTYSVTSRKLPTFGSFEPRIRWWIPRNNDFEKPLKNRRVQKIDTYHFINKTNHIPIRYKNYFSRKFSSANILTCISHLFGILEIHFYPLQRYGIEWYLTKLQNKNEIIKVSNQ